MALAWIIVLVCPLYSQEINSFRTASSGLFNNLGTWEIYDGATWNSASFIPNATNDIYIDQGHTLSLSGNQSVKSVFINSETGAGQKLLLNGNALEIFGTLQAFTGAAPGTPTGTWNSQNWIGNSIDSRLVFRGSSRTIIPQNSWSGFSVRSRYSVIFDPGDGVELTIEEPIKSMRFIIRSGTLIQALDNSVAPAVCATLSFNSENFFGLDEFGELIIENGGTFISRCNSNILFRSASRSAALFEIMDGGEAIFEGSSPELEVFQYQLDGKVTFASGTNTKAFITRSFASSSLPTEVHDLELRSSQNLIIPANLSVSGDLIQSSTGELDFSSSTLQLIGSDDQNISGFPLITFNLTLNKPNGEVNFDRDLFVLSELNLISGGLNLQEQDLSINISGLGGIQYQGGYWRNLADFTHFNIPPILNEVNFTLPFLDQFQGGIRKVQLLGTSPGGALTVSFQEFSGALFDPQFNDTDGTPILYQLFSFFDFSGITPSALPVEMRISADQLIVNNVDDLRIISPGYAAPGTHLPGQDPIELWARRSLTFSDLEDSDFTIGSFRALSILPVQWLGLSANHLSDHTLISWEIAQEQNNELFEIYRSLDGVNDWEKLGEVRSLGDTDSSRYYEYADFTRQRNRVAYYRLKQLDFSGISSYSDVVRSAPLTVERLKIYPNPHFSGPIEIVLPKTLEVGSSYVKVIGIGSTYLYQAQLNPSELSSHLSTLPLGIYVIEIVSEQTTYVTRFLKK